MLAIYPCATNFTTRDKQGTVNRQAPVRGLKEFMPTSTAGQSSQTFLSFNLSRQRSQVLSNLSIALLRESLSAIFGTP